MDVQWQRNKFITLYSKMKVRIGGKDPVTIEAGDLVEYDGTILKYAGLELAQPGLRSSVREGWFTDNEDEIGSRVAAVVPTRNVAKSQTKNEDLQHVQRHDATPLQTDHQDEDTVLNVSDRRPTASPDKSHPGGRNIRAEPRKLTSADNRKKGFRSGGLVVNPGAIEEQDYTPVGRMRTAAKIKVDMSSPESHSIKSQLDNLKGSGFIPNHTVEHEGVSIRTNLGKMDRSAPVEIAQEGEGRLVGKVRHSSKSSSNADGVEVRDTSNIRSERAVASNAAPPPNGKKIDTKLNPRIRAARRIDPSFPTSWDFSGKLVERLDRAKKHGATPEFLEALYAAEGDQFRKVLEKEFPKQFGG